MIKFVKNKLKEEKGLTLIELLAVIVILGIIAAIAIPAIGNIITNSRVNALKSDGLNVLSAANVYFAEHADATSVDQDALGDYLDNPGGFDNQDFSVEKKSGGNLLNGTAEYSDEISVEFVNATVKAINDAGTKSDEGNANVIITRP